MRRYILLLLMIIGVNLNGQLNIESVFHGVSVSINHSKSGLMDYSQDYGFGFSVIHVEFEKHRINLVTSLEYNRTNQFYEYQTGGQYYNYTDVTYKMNFISVPIGMRINIDHSQVFSIEFGAYMDFGIKGLTEGTSHTDIVDAENHTITGVNISEFSNEVRMNDIFGIYSAVNIQIPFLNNWIVIKPEYKIGLNSLRGLNNINSNYLRFSIGYRFI